MITTTCVKKSENVKWIKITCSTTDHLTAKLASANVQMLKFSPPSYLALRAGITDNTSKAPLILMILIYLYLPIFSRSNVRRELSYHL